jgi:aminopeptidase N
MPPAERRRKILFPKAMSILRFAQAAIAALASSFASAQAGEGRAPGAGVDVLGYSVEVTPDFNSRSLVGSTRIEFVALENNLREVVFSNNALEIDTAQLDGKPVAVSRRRDSLVVALPRPFSKGRSGTLWLTYHGRPARGVTFADSYLFTSYWACDWMICSQDSFRDKATFELRLRLPQGMKSLAAGSLQTLRAGSSGQQVHVWRESRPYSSYLFGFAAGRFNEAADRIGGRQLAYLSPTASPDEMKALFSTTASMVRFLEAKAGLPLPTRRYTQLLVPGSEAQEAAT